MKQSLKYKLLVLTVFFCLGSNLHQTLYAQQIETSISYQVFYDGLSPFGIWIAYPGYGHVWHPFVDGNFQPYLTNGYWEYSPEGWMWVSLYSWGWAPFHYGRWIYDELYGWLWVPGYEWAPAWVIWGEIDNYYAWAPLMPSVNVSIWFGTWRPPAIVYWNVIERIYIYDRDLNNRGRSNMDTDFIGRVRIIDNQATTRIHNQVYSQGPDAAEVEKFTRKKISSIPIRDQKKPEFTPAEKELKVYRPRVNTPEPRTYRNIETVSPNPLPQKIDRSIQDRMEQRRNVEQLPVRTAPPKTSQGRSNKINKSRGK
ncbi:MAG: DUF6600 domain-containing protein [Aequorivita sp.]